MKSITIKKPDGTLILKVLHRKNGQFDVELLQEASDWKVEIRDKLGRKVWMK